MIQPEWTRPARFGALSGGVVCRIVSAIRSRPFSRFGSSAAVDCDAGAVGRAGSAAAGANAAICAGAILTFTVLTWIGLMGSVADAAGGEVAAAAAKAAAGAP